MLHLFCTFFFPNYLFWAVLGFRSFAQDFFSCSEQGLLLVMLLGRLTAVTSLLAECGLSTRGLSRCGAGAQWLCGMNHESCLLH